ncbi:hypothetical protein TSUD_412360 [Trifolium subterraneum]|uniref:Carboxypeptidase n=1 Tax=Trifolium subterraneum TaxID=3900 RepID=A0A2Z6P488_TRISU|nr:hypothetical protein TSUD_412360 [Trifolium subterraneum]
MKKCWFVGVLIVVSLLGTTIWVEGYPIEDLVVRLPGQPKVEFKQYAGYVDIDLKHGRSLFYYFVEAEHDPHKKPLTLWLNGGPGCSSLGGGAFTELGPFYPTGDARGLRKNSKSWNRASNLLFVESPAGVGWSYSNTTSDYNTGDTTTANDMLLFFLKWYEKFPSYKSRKLFLTGESYAGHYIPQLANAILDYNAHSTNFKFNIKGLAIGNPLLDLGRDTRATYEYFWSHGMISDEIGIAIMNDCDFDDYTDPEVQKALHANRTNLPYRWTMCSRILNYSESDPNINILPILKRIIQNHIPVLVYSGDQDSVVPLLGTRTLIRELAHDLKFKITDPYRVWFHKGQVGGWVTEYGNLLRFATVRGAGHMVPYGQPSRALHLFSSFVSNKRLPNTTQPSIG